MICQTFSTCQIKTYDARETEKNLRSQVIAKTREGCHINQGVDKTGGPFFDGGKKKRRVFIKLCDKQNLLLGQCGNFYLIYYNPILSIHMYLLSIQTYYVLFICTELACKASDKMV